MTLIQATKVVGLKVITLHDGKEIDTVKDVIYDPTQNRVRALLVDAGGWFKDARMIDIDEVRAIGTDAVMIEDEAAVKAAANVSDRVANIASDKNYLTKTKIISEEGKNLGAISDLFFTLPGGAVQEFEVSGGLVSDLTSGKNRIAIGDIITIGADATIVRTQTELKIDEQNQTQGVQGAAIATAATVKSGWEVASEKAAQGLEFAKEKAGEAKEYVQSGKLQEDAGNLMEKAGDKAQQAKEYLAPKMEEAGAKIGEVANNVKETVSPKLEELKQNVAPVIDGAKDKLAEAWKNTEEKASETKEYIQSGEAQKDATETAQNIGQKAQEVGQNIAGKASEIKDKVSPTIQNATDKVGQAASSVQQFSAQKTDQAVGAVQSTRKSEALGQYLKINILGSGDQLIGSIGDIITNEMIDLAEKNNQLNKLLSNTSKTPITPDLNQHSKF